MLKLPPFKKVSKEPSRHKHSLASQALSGRLILTIVAAISFYKLISTICSLLILKSEILVVSDITTILSTMLIVMSNVFTFYFMKATLRNENDDKPPKQEDENGDTGK